MKQRRKAWFYGPDTPTDRARTIARSCWTALHAANPAIAEQIRQLAAEHGEDFWLVPKPASAEGGWLTRDQVATIGGVRPDAVSNWSGRGLTRAGENRTLTRHPEGYHPEEVTAFLHWRDTAPARLHERSPRQCSTTRSPLSRPAATPSARAVARPSTSTRSPA